MGESMNDGRWYDRIRMRRYVLAAVAIVAAQAIVLYAMGRVPICKCGYVKLWHGVVQSAENSQHVADWYSPSHVIHGFIFYGLLWLVWRRWPAGLRLVIAVLVEASWELLENSSLIIERYRAVTMSLDYYGDSILNSVSDVLFCVTGFALARRLPVWAIIGCAVGLELLVAWFIRDNLTLNIIMLIHPVGAVRAWQAGG
jgi:hypothetical protein